MIPYIEQPNPYSEEEQMAEIQTLWPHTHRWDYGYANGVLVRHCGCGKADRQERLWGWAWKVWRSV